MGLFSKKEDRLGLRDPTGLIRSVRTRRKKHLRHGWQWVAIGVVALVVAVGGFGWWVYADLLDDVRTPVRPVTPPAGDEPYNVLLVGSDSRRGLTRQEQHELGANPVRSQRADTLIIAHVDPTERRITMVQFPRDLYVPMPDEGRARINSALEKGHDYLVRAVEDVTGLDINRYAQVNIAGFRDVVDAIGGVDICITEPIPFDENTGFGISQNELGLVHFDGEEALRFVRSRKTLPGGDFDRIRNQQKFLAAAIDKVLSFKTLLNPSSIRRIKNGVGNNVRIDSHSDFGDLKTLADQLKELDPKRYEAYTVPNNGPVTVGEASVVAPDTPAMRLMFEALDDNESPADADGVPSIAPSAVRVGVYNGSGESGAAGRAANALERATNTDDGPVNIVTVGNAPRRTRRTLVVYRPQNETAARLVAGVIPGARLVEGKTARRVDAAVIVGRSFRTTRLIQILPIPLPAPGAVPAECRR